jgi:ABC-type glutathione transport system ATPase component
VSSERASPEAVLDVAGLTVSYATRRGRLNALSDVSFSIAKGETLALVGESGSGKSTASLAITGLLGREATIHAGRILFNGRDLARLAPAERQALRGDRVSIVFQDPFTSLNPALPVGLQVAEPLIYHRAMPQAAALEKAVEALAEVGLPHPGELARVYPHQLSGGMQQRIGLARALAIDPAILLMDEPFSALDAQTREVLQAELLRIHAQTNKTTVFVTHDLDEALYLSDRVVVLAAKPGRVKQVIDIPFAYPRPALPELRGDPVFQEIRAAIWSLIRSSSAEHAHESART